MNFEAVIGLEIHVQMKTKSKTIKTAPESHCHSLLPWIKRGSISKAPPTQKEISSR